MWAGLRYDVKAALARDPAARSAVEVAVLYPGIHALFFYRIGNAFWRRRWYFLGRLFGQLGRFITGIEIHPGATIGRGLFIDHGVGVVIGETAEIGNDVTLYQGVTLGGTSLEKGKRHPTLDDGVIVGAGAKILGPITIGRNARIGSNAVVVKDVPAGATAVGIPARLTRQPQQQVCDESFCAYGIPGDLPDPVARAMDGLLDRVQTLSARIEALEAERRNADEVLARLTADRWAPMAEAETGKKPVS